MARGVIPGKGVVALKEGQKGLNQSGYPKETQRSGNKHHVFPLSDLLLGEGGFGEDDADYEKCGEPQELKNLQPGNIVDLIGESLHGMDEWLKA